MPFETYIERRFNIPNGNVIATFCKPVITKTGEFVCQWHLEWPDRKDAGDVFGEDGVQALMLALRKVSDALKGSDLFKAGALTLWGQHDLDLPPGWGTGSLYTVPHPPEP